MCSATMRIFSSIIGHSLVNSSKGDFQCLSLASTYYHHDGVLGGVGAIYRPGTTIAWSQGSPTRWTRPLNGMEGYFNFIGHYTLLTKIRVELDRPELRYQQPQISAKAENMGLVYKVADETRVAEWAAETFLVSSASNADELCQSVQPIKQAMLYYIAASSELVLRTRHTLVDGTGTPSGTRRGLGQSRITNAADRAAALLGPVAEHMPGIGPVSKFGTAPSGCSRNREYVFSAQKTAAVIKACKDRSISVTSALHAAYVQTITKYADPTANVSRYVTVNSLSLRQYLPESYNTLPFMLDTPASFSEAAAALHKHYQIGFKNNIANREICVYMACMLRDMVQTPKFQPKTISRDALVSSLGIMEEPLERAYGTTVTVKDFMFGAETVLGISMSFIYMFHDQLRLVYSFNDGFEEEYDIQMYLEEIDNVDGGAVWLSVGS
ncbi:hypothetical protein BDV33DRAFT_194795 [Aspergillus novoparasiticus]|uniref:Uncharacterized protein n=1 Tax=Aspergillus novoparasiticus TaxID=986946 RepID=A0A5N6EFD3_9EURO|nr:hypothetical protein BDV33DRAFT_194795 [Aspergillus novoparasiticus]